MRNHSHENDFDLHGDETAYCMQNSFSYGRFRTRLILKQRHKNRKWPIFLLVACLPHYACLLLRILMLA